MKSDFLKQEKDRLTQRLIDDISLSNEQVPLKKILQKKYPLLFQERAKKEAYKILDQENPIELKTGKRFNFDGDIVKTQVSDLKKSILLELFFSAKEIKKFAKFSVWLQVDIIIKPRQTILNILFKKEKEIDKTVAMDIIAGFGEERPFIRKLIAALDNENTTKIQMEDINKLSEKIERNVYKLTPISSFLTDVGLYLDFEISITGDSQTLFRSEILQEMFTKRGLERVSKSIAAEEERDFWTITEIESAFERFLLVGNLEQEEQVEVIEKTEKKKTELSAKQQKREDAEKRQINFLENFSKPIADPVKPKNGEVINGSSGSGGTKPPNGSRKNGQSNLNGNKAQRPQISALINQDDKDFLVSTIFNNKADDFSQFIEKLDLIKKWQTARVAINEEIVKRNISPYSKEAILLGDVVFSRYFTAK